MHLLAYSDLFLPAVEQHLQLTLDEYLKPVFPELREAIFYQFGFSGMESLKMKGKRIRPLLVLLSADLLSVDWRKVLPAASAIEMLHNFSLIHDDIEDHSPLRRGKETIWKKWGMEKAVNIGDMLFILAVQTMQTSTSNCGTKESLEGVALFMLAASSIMQGQQMDMAFEGNTEIVTEDYLTMIREKTAALIAHSCEISAVLAGSDPTIRQKLHTFGMNLGMAFQVYDDWLGIWGKENQTGKTACSDLIEKKVSYPVLLGLQQSASFHDAWHADHPITIHQAQEMAVLLSRIGIEVQVLEKAAYYNNIALKALESMHGKESAKDALKSLAEDLVKRKY
ncbi:MAG: polyprenyl synthetase family protein [Anaerolineaceae bacterium]